MSENIGNQLSVSTLGILCLVHLLMIFVQHIQLSLRHDIHVVKITAASKRKEGLLGPVGAEVVNGNEDSISLELEHQFS